MENAQLWRVLETAAAARAGGGEVRRDAGGSAMQLEAKLREREAAVTPLAASQVQARKACLSKPYPLPNKGRHFRPMPASCMW